MMTRKAALLAATAATLLPAMALAQEARETTVQTAQVGADTADADSGIEEIIVTARKTEELLSDAPVSVSALSEAKITELGLNSIDDFAKQATGISFSQAFGRSSDRPVIRGQSNVLANVQFGVETGAAYFVDGIYYQGDIQSFDPESLARVEIIKGPQSALYGRNTYAGAINYVTKDPGQEFSGSARASAAEHDEYSIAGSVSGPIIADVLGFRAGGRYFTYGGEYTNQLTGKKVGSEESRSGYLLLNFTPGENFKVRVRGQYQEDDDGPLALFLTGAQNNNCKPGFRSIAFRQQNLPATVPDGAVFQPAIGTSTNNNQYFCGVIQPQPNNVRLNTDPVTTPFGVRDGTAFDGIENKQWLFSSIIDWDVGGSGWVASSLTGYRDNTNLFGTDSDHSEGYFFLFPPIPPATSEPAFANTTRKETWDVSQEIRIASPTENRVRVLLGAYYFKQEFELTDLTFASGRAGLALGTDGSQFSTIEDRAVFGLVGFDVTDKLTVTGEIRYAEEDKTIIDRAAATQIFCAGEDGRRTQFGATAACLDKATFEGWDPRVTVDYKASDDVLFYGVYAQGRKPGGFNGTGGVAATALTGTDQTRYLPEKARGGELGVKFDALDRTLRMSIAGFYNELTNVQLTRSIPPTVPSQATTSIVTNQGDAKTQGFEIEAQAVPMEGLNLSLGVSYVDAHFTSGCDADFFTLNSGGLRPNFDSTNPPAAALPLCSIKGKKLPLGSPYLVNGSATYELPLGSGDMSWFTNANFSYEDQKYVQTDNLAKVGDSFLLNGRIGVRSERFSISLFGRNLLDEDSVPLATRWFDYRYGNAGRGLPTGNLSTFNGLPAAVDTGAPRAFFAALRKGRTFGIEGSFKF